MDTQDNFNELTQNIIAIAGTPLNEDQVQRIAAACRSYEGTNQQCEMVRHFFIAQIFAGMFANQPQKEETIDKAIEFINKILKKI